MSKKIPYRTIATFLKSLGFQEKKFKGAHIVFSLPESNVVIVLPYYTANKSMTSPHLSMIKRTLIEKGIVSEDAFYDALHLDVEKVFA
jgi:predicted RNA binding protein YcfA (HicA-like mRNA interferase family)